MTTHGKVMAVEAVLSDTQVIGTRAPVADAAPSYGGGSLAVHPARSTMTVADVMTPDPQVVTPEDPVVAAAAVMRDRNIGFLPVVTDRQSFRLAGVITDRDIAIRCVANGHQSGCRVQDHMSRSHLRAVSPGSDVHEVLEAMEQRQVRRIPVVREDGRLVGIVSLADLALRLGPLEPLQIEDLVSRLSAPSLPIYF